MGKWLQLNSSVYIQCPTEILGKDVARRSYESRRNRLKVCFGLLVVNPLKLYLSASGGVGF